MSATNATLATGLQLTLAAVGLVLLWRLVLAPDARAQRPPARLTTWDIPLASFLLLLWIVLTAGGVVPFVMQKVAVLLDFGEQAQATFRNLGFQGGMLAGIALFHRFLAPRNDEASCPFGGVFVSGVTTFLISLPLVMVVSLVWTGLLKLCGLPIESQDAVALFKSIKSPALLATMVVLATVIAPLNEELLFRAGIFRYARTRLPRWAALLLPACIFAALHTHLPSFAPLALLGVIWSLAYERTGKIGTTIVAHTLFNLYSVVILLINPNVT